MKFRIISSCYVFDIETEQLLDEYPVLKKYGLEVIEETRTSYEDIRITDENGLPMTQKVLYPYKIKIAYVNINTIEQLMNLIKDVEYPVIVTEDEIEIYDGYRE